MTPDMATLVQRAQAELDRQAEELSVQQERRLRAVQVRRATGTNSISHAFKLDCRFRLVYVRCRFVGGAGTAVMRISLSSSAGSAYNAQLLTIGGAGTGADVNQRMDAAAEPSGWTFQAGDAVKIDWVNPAPGVMTWGLEVGLAPAS